MTCAPRCGMPLLRCLSGHLVWLHGAEVGASALQEAASAFGDSRMLIEKVARKRLRGGCMLCTTQFDSHGAHPVVPCFC